MAETKMYSIYSVNQIGLRPLQYELMELLYQNGPSWIQEIIEFLDQPKTTLINNLAYLVKNKKFIQIYKKKLCSGRGCPRTFYKLSKEGNLYFQKILSGRRRIIECPHCGMQLTLTETFDTCFGHECTSCEKVFTIKVEVSK